MKTTEPKDKARELIKLFDSNYPHALRCVDEIWKGIDENFRANPNTPSLSEYHWNKMREYYKEVKQEIEKL